MSQLSSDTFLTLAFGASFGGIEALSVILRNLPKPLKAAVAIVQHRSEVTGLLAEVLSYKSGRLVMDAVEGDRLAPGRIFLAPAGVHLLINVDGTLSLSGGPRARSSRPAADRLFMSGAESLGPRLIAVVLTGYDGDGSDGVEAVRRQGGLIVVQDPDTAKAPGMPESALKTGSVDYVVSLEDMGATLGRLIECV